MLRVSSLHRSVACKYGTGRGWLDADTGKVAALWSRSDSAGRARAVQGRNAAN